jgi:hypothetical protein
MELNFVVEDEDGQELGRFNAFWKIHQAFPNANFSSIETDLGCEYWEDLELGLFVTLE